MGKSPTSAGAAPWTCPVCRASLALDRGQRRWTCQDEHSFDVAREGYVNLLVASKGRSRHPGDSAEMVSARRRFLATGAFDPMSSALAEVVAAERPTVLLDVGCGEGRHTRQMKAPMVLGVDVAKKAVAAAAHAGPCGWYAAASAAELPLPDGSVDAVLVAFGPVMPAELARVVRPSGLVVIASPGPSHLQELRALVYQDARPHELKGPLGDEQDWFQSADGFSVQFPVVVHDRAQLDDLFSMTPYRWHARPDIHDRLAAAVTPTFKTTADVRVTTYRRTTSSLS